MPLGPGANAYFARLIAFFTSLHVRGLVSIWCACGWIGGMSSGIGKAMQGKAVLFI